jgi:hypothetical protein
VYDDISPEKVSTNLSPQFALFWKLVVRPLTMSYEWGYGVGLSFCEISVIKNSRTPEQYM